MWSISSADFYDRGSVHENGLLWKKMSFYVEHIMPNIQRSPEWITVDGRDYSHSEFNLSTLKAHLKKPPIADLLWLRFGLLCRLKETQKCCKFSVTHW